MTSEEIEQDIREIYKEVDSGIEAKRETESEIQKQENIQTASMRTSEVKKFKYFETILSFGILLIYSLIAVSFPLSTSILKAVLTAIAIAVLIDVCKRSKKTDNMPCAVVALVGTIAISIAWGLPMSIWTL